MGLKGAWVKFRKPISKYPETPQQRKVRIGGLLIKEMCKGKKGPEFFECRTEVLKCAFEDKECEEELLELKRKILLELEIEEKGAVE